MKIDFDLKPNEIAFLEYLNGLPSADNLPDCWTLNYGVNTVRVSKIFKELGLVEYKKDYKNALSRLYISQLKDILKSNSLKVSGNKETLCERILGNVDIDWIDDNIKEKNFFILTDKGTNLLKKYELCVVNIKDHYYFSDQEIFFALDLKNVFSTNDRIWRILCNRVENHFKENNLYDIKYDYYSMANFLYNKEKKFNIAINYYIAYFILCLSKLDNYFNIKNTFIEENNIKQIKNCINLLDIKDITALILNNNLCNNFQCYYSKEQLCVILNDCLSGKEYNYKNYIKSKSILNLISNFFKNN